MVDGERNIWTIDSGNNYLQSFVPTEYASTIYQAIHLYNETQYEASIALWQDVLRLNQLSVLAHNGLAKNYLQTEQYQLAAYHFEIAGNRELFSEAFWEIRNLWLQANLLSDHRVGDSWIRARDRVKSRGQEEAHLRADSDMDKQSVALSFH
ncbi:MAG: hypothetical protein MZU79_02760 [Anaerotruncus sp.]|nr:hypothetical protein [Anaerotruncus sp.]